MWFLPPRHSQPTATTKIETAEVHLAPINFIFPGRIVSQHFEAIPFRQQSSSVILFDEFDALLLYQPLPTLR